MVTIHCLDCEYPTKLKWRPKKGEIIPCWTCGAELEIIRVEPLELQWAGLEPAEDDEDWLWWQENKDREEVTLVREPDLQPE